MEHDVLNGVNILQTYLEAVRYEFGKVCANVNAEENQKPILEAVWREAVCGIERKAL